MKFSEQLQFYMNELGVSSRELARESGISESALSRYRSGERTPSADEKRLHGLAEALVRASTLSVVPYSAEEIYLSFMDIVGSGLTIPYENYLENLHQLMEIMGIRSNALAKELAFDPSYISRILSGKRKPAEIRTFNAQVVSVVLKNAEEREREETLATLLRIPVEVIRDPEKKEEALLAWLGTNTEKVATHPVRRFLRGVEGFDIEEYFRTTNIEEVKRLVPPAVSLPKRKVYIGITSMLEAQADFMRLTVLNRSTDTVFMYTDFSSAEVMRRPDFLKRYLIGINSIIRRGLKIKIIHNVHRPLSEMLLTLEMHVPLYLTGQVEPYYMNKSQGDIFSHHLWVSGGLALFGEGVIGYLTEGMHVLTNHAAELRYARKRAKRLLESAYPLMQIYRGESYDQLRKENGELFQIGDRSLSYSYLPVSYLSPEEIDAYMQRAGVKSSTRRVIQIRAEYRRQSMANRNKESHVRLYVPDITEEEFQKNPILLSFAELGLDLTIEYSYEEYRKHLEKIRLAGEQSENVETIFGQGHTLRAVNIYLFHGKAVVIMKCRSPLSCIIMRHPSMLRAFDELIGSLRKDAVSTVYGQEGEQDEKNGGI